MSSQASKLSRRQRMIAGRYAAGDTYREIAASLHIAPSTVRNHLAAIYRKLSVRGKAGLINALAPGAGGAMDLPPPESNVPTAAALRTLEEQAPPLPPGASIAVVPFAWLGGDTQWEHVSDGVTADIHDDLTRFRDLFVCGRSSCLAVSRQTDDAREIARRLGVHYVVQGSVRADGAAVRISAELIDGATGGVLWSERHDRTLRDIFALESEVANAIAATLSVRIEDAQYERRKSCSPETLRSYDWQVRGNRSLERGGSENISEAKRCFLRALELEPESASACAGLSMCYGYECWDLIAQDYARSLAQHRELARRAIALDESNSRGHYAMACTHQLVGELELADVHAARALELNPSEYHNICTRGYTLMCLGRLEESVACFNSSLRRNPLAPNSCLLGFGLIEYLETNYGQCAQVLARLSGEEVRRLSCLAATYSQLGYQEAAHEAARALRSVLVSRRAAPVGSGAGEWQRFWRKVYPFMREEPYQHLLEGIARAGLPV